MDLLNVLAFFLIACAFHVQEKSAKRIKRPTPPAITEELIRKELERFAPFQEALQGANLNITVVFSHSKKDENDTLIQYDSVEFRPLTSKYNSSGPQVHNKLDENQLQGLFKFAEDWNMFVVASKEKFSEDGFLQSKAVYAKDIEIFYEDGASNVIVSSMKNKMEEKDFENFIKMLKQYEFPVMVHKTLFDEKGKILKTETSEYKPRKVKIVAGDMQIAKQLKAAEALKRAFTMKEDGNDRVRLLCKYLKVQYPQFHWQAVIGDGEHFVYSKEWVKLALEGQTYTIIANKEE